MSGSIPVRCRWPSGTIPSRTRKCSSSSSRPITSAKRLTRPRGWFYTLHAISTLLFDQECFKNVICLGLVVDANGQKMSKSRGNVIDPWDVLNESGADAFRWYFYTSAPPNAERRFAPSMVTDVVKNFTLTLWNVYSFFVTYANLDKPDLTHAGQEPGQMIWIAGCFPR